MNYIVPHQDNFPTFFLFTISETVYESGHIVPFQIMFSNNLDNLSTLTYRKLRLMARKMNILRRSRMNKTILTNEVRQRIIFE